MSAILLVPPRPRVPMWRLAPIVLLLWSLPVPFALLIGCDDMTTKTPEPSDPSPAA